MSDYEMRKTMTNIRNRYKNRDSSSIRYYRNLGLVRSNNNIWDATQDAVTKLCFDGGSI